jgi:hypothetical protein
MVRAPARNVGIDESHVPGGTGSRVISPISNSLASPTVKGDMGENIMVKYL